MSKCSCSNPCSSQLRKLYERRQVLLVLQKMSNTLERGVTQKSGPKMAELSFFSKFPKTSQQGDEAHLCLPHRIANRKSQLGVIQNKMRYLSAVLWIQ